MPKNDLPIYELESAVVEALTKDNRLILQAPTGSGMTPELDAPARPDATAARIAARRVNVAPA